MSKLALKSKNKKVVGVEKQKWLAGLASGNRAVMVAADCDHVMVIGADKAPVKVQLPMKHHWQCVASNGHGRWIAVAFNSDIVAVSEDNAKTWEIRILPAVSGWYDIKYAVGLWVIVSHTSDSCLVSADGLSWRVGYLPKGFKALAVTYGNGTWVAIEPGNRAAYSADGVKWHISDMPSNQLWWSVAYKSGRFVAIAKNTNLAAFSTDGVKWQLTVLPEENTWWRIRAFGNWFLAIANASNKLAYSLDGLEWRMQVLPYAGAWFDIMGTDDNSSVVLLEYNSNTLLFREDGTYSPYTFLKEV